MDHTDVRPDAIQRALRTVIDPELGLDIVTLGLVYDVAVVDDVARVTHTLTTRGCPMEGIIRQGICDALASIAGVRAIELRLTWDPAWHPRMIARGAWHD